MAAKQPMPKRTAVFWPFSMDIVEDIEARPIPEHSLDANSSMQPEHQFSNPRKRSRLTQEQVRLLEESFNRDKKLEAGTKQELAEKLNLQPRQVVIWFQNRKARFKAKNLEQRYGELKSQYDSIVLERDKLKTELMTLIAKLSAKECASENVAEPLTENESLWSPTQQTRCSRSADRSSQAHRFMDDYYNDFQDFAPELIAMGETEAEAAQYGVNGTGTSFDSEQLGMAYCAALHDDYSYMFKVNHQQHYYDQLADSQHGLLLSDMATPDWQREMPAYYSIIEPLF